MSLKNDIQKLTSRLDTCQRKLEAAKSRADDAMISQFTQEEDQLSKQIKSLKNKEDYQINKERKKLSDMPFFREITKSEQADLGKLKKSVKGLVIVHPMTRIGKELRLEVMTGFAPRPF